MDLLAAGFVVVMVALLLVRCAGRKICKDIILWRIDDLDIYSKYTLPALLQETEEKIEKKNQ